MLYARKKIRIWRSSHWSKKELRIVESKNYSKAPQGAFFRSSLQIIEG
jgi:hypothetical protein